ncbi:MAG: NAD(P)-dependent oxidoreductase [bacterium]|nr:NAD(P)-dependent oxidoreductase [bacterium]MDE0289195.1 NAD(P)-dependent oxidoreductase [bacterium]MDE0436782.1 NAD(P)-dependent oxidoreductase [bacterium]
MVTGGAGRSGTVIAAHLRSAGADVLTVDLVAPRGGDAGSHIGSHLFVDLADLGEAVEAFRGADAVLHLAGVWAQGVRTPGVTFNTNVRTTFNVFEAAAIAGVRRVVWASTQAVTGNPWGPDNLPEYLPISESLPARPRGTYALSKHVGEQIGPYFSETRGLEVVGLRLAWMIHEGGWGVVPEWQENPLSRRFNAFVYVDVRDVAAACAAAIEAPLRGAHVINIGSADTCMDIPSSELAAVAFGDVPLRRPLVGYETLVSIRAARELIGYRPRFSWRDHLS